MSNFTFVFIFIKQPQKLILSAFRADKIFLSVKYGFFRPHPLRDTLYRLTTWCNRCTRFRIIPHHLLRYSRQYNGAAKPKRQVSLSPISWRPMFVRHRIFRFENAALRIVVQCITMMPKAYLSRCNKHYAL